MRYLAVIAMFLTACGGKETSPAAGGPAGEVVRAEGAVTATRAAQGAQPRALTATAQVFADDTIATAADGSVDIRLLHNQAVWKLGPAETRRVDASAAWRAPKGSSEASAFASGDEDRTASAGRHTDMAFEEGKMGKRPTKGGGWQNGYGLRGTGPGGGGGDIGDAKGIGTIGHGGGGGSGSGYGSGSGSSGGSGSKPTLRATMGVVTVDGPLSKDVIRRVMRSRFPALKRCYEHELEKDPSFTAEVNAMFTVGKDGGLSEITVDPDVSASFTACLKAAIRAVQAPAGDEETEVTLPLVFKQ